MKFYCVSNFKTTVIQQATLNKYHIAITSKTYPMAVDKCNRILDGLSQHLAWKNRCFKPKKSPQSGIKQLSNNSRLSTIDINHRLKASEVTKPPSSYSPAALRDRIYRYIHRKKIPVLRGRPPTLHLMYKILYSTCPLDKCSFFPSSVLERETDWKPIRI